MKVDITHIFETIYREESDTIFRFCLIRVSDREQALDITQETFVRLWKTLMEDKLVTNNKAFLFKIARNLIIDWYRKKKSVSLDKMLEKETDGSPFDVVDHDTLENLGLQPEGRYLIEKIEKLSPASREPVYMRFVEGMSPAEIGDVLGISANAASVRVNRGLLELRKKTGYNNTEDK